MKKILLIAIACLLCASCGVKSKPEYKSHNNQNITIRLG